ncbi:MAG: LPS export ABC transporter permease LptF [Natronospirillum sp.]|uniref:LPS export ABC transporter permease LptF n=1 Tax=Natronospirillum sp. TaxID=2812955 RepID=UPI0025F8BF3E|nr:LPS export ABC transporter permease LptF [Natronospirillum sp.]MCH8553024.1 LPS export ABC transporter permease LptF [Natronospirillum sp.]
MIIQRYILRLVAIPFLFISLLITALMLAEVFGEVLTRALGGTLPGGAVALLILLEVPAVLLELMPGAFFLSSVIALGQLSASSERVVLQAVGYSDNRILSLMLSVAALVTGLLFFFSLFLVPWSGQQVYQLERVLAERPAAELVQPGEFAPVGPDGSTLHARRSDPDTGDLLDVFMAYVQDDEQRLVTAQRARVERQDNAQFLVLTDGELLRESLEDDTLEKNIFETLSLRLEIPEASTSLSRSAQPIAELWESSNMRDKTEAQQRVLYPFTALVFAVWAVTLTRYTPRSGKNAAVLPAVIIYVLYMYLMRTVNINVRNEAFPLWANYWWLHILAIMMALLFRFDFKGWLTNLWWQFYERVRPTRAESGGGSST